MVKIRRSSTVALAAAGQFLLSLIVLSAGGDTVTPASALFFDDGGSSGDDPLTPISQADKKSGRDVILSWNEEALDTVRELRLGAFDAARTYAIVNAAIFDAVAALDRKLGRNEAVFAARRPGNVRVNSFTKTAAATGAARAALTGLFPDRADLYDDTADDILDGLPQSPKFRQQIRRAANFGASVGTKVVAIRETDGTSPKVTLPGGTGPGVFRADFGSAAFGNMDEFIIEDAAAYKSGGPPSLSSPEYQAAHTEVRLLGDASYENQEYEEIFSFWKAGGGSVRPPGEWIKAAIVLADDKDLDLEKSAVLLATLALGLADTAVAVASDKAQYQYWRPATAIREADTDGNAGTVQDGSWEPRNGSIGGSPEHTSGQSAFAGCASTILADFFGTNEFEFTIEGDNAIAGPRTYKSFSEAAAEAGRSRIFSGIHFEFSNQAGQQTGRDVAREVIGWQKQK